MKEKSQGGVQLKQVTNEACNNVNNCKMITMSSLKPIKIVDKEQHGTIHPKR